MKYLVALALIAALAIGCTVTVEIGGPAPDAGGISIDAYPTDAGIIDDADVTDADVEPDAS